MILLELRKTCPEPGLGFFVAFEIERFVGLITSAVFGGLKTGSVAQQGILKARPPLDFESTASLFSVQSALAPVTSHGFVAFDVFSFIDQTSSLYISDRCINAEEAIKLQFKV